MKQYSNLRRWAVMAGVCLFLVGILSASFGWTTASSSRPAAERESRNVMEALSQAPVAWPAPDAPARPAQEILSEAASPGPDAERAVRRAWDRARKVGAYRFGTDLVQTAYPALTLSNAGNGAQRNELHLEGTVDLPAQSIELRMWGGAGNILTEGSGSEARFEDGRAYLRSAGGNWKEIEDFTSSFAPNADPLAFLAGIKNVRPAPVEENTLTPHVSRFAFDLDGPALATYMRDRLEEQLRERGELPLNLTLDVSTEFRDATGEGDLWVDNRGLPVRLAMHLRFPEKRSGAHVEADIRTDFSGYPEQMIAGPSLLDRPIDWAASALSPAQHPDEWSAAGQQFFALALGAAVLVFLLGGRRWRKVYTAVAITVVLSMVVTPLLQSEQATAFFERHAAATTQDPEENAHERGEAQAATDNLAERMGTDWDPHQDPLARGRPEENQSTTAPMQPDLSLPRLGAPTLAPAQVEPPEESACDQVDTADPDSDGLSNYEECQYLTDPDDPDSDDDGLSDGQELNRLGTDPNYWDTDGDQITDTLEVEGFLYAGKRWYLNPTNPDTNNDGQLDSMECLVLTTDPAPDVEVKCDTDSDIDPAKIPDPFDIDNDNDGVPDRVDLSAETRVDRIGLGIGQPTDATAFDKRDPFLLTMSDLQPDWPVLVDFQIRPTNPDHLAYALNVLDWPSDDRDGQIQHGKETTFATSDNPDIVNPDDDAGSHGDMRLVPLLELTIPGDQVPLKLTDQKVIVEASGAFSATVVLAPNAVDAGQTDLAFTFQWDRGHSVAVYEGACPGIKPSTPTFSEVASDQTRTYAMKLNNLANGEHALIIWWGPDTVCAEIPDMVTGPYADAGKMIDQSVFEPYGFTMHDTDAGALQAYLPLNVVSDDTGGGKTAFQARMIYWPGATNIWLEAQQLRVVWLVNMLTDDCDDSGFPDWDEYQTTYPDNTQDDYDEAREKHCETHRTIDQIKPVQTYYENWYLTGLSVREDHGLDVAVAYPHPDKTKAYDDDALWGLSWGLGQQFVTGRECETNTSLYDNADDTNTCYSDSPRDLPDIAVFAEDKFGNRSGNSTISERFAYTSTVTGNAKWNIPAQSLDVQDFRYDDVDYLSYMAANVTPEILKQYDTSIVPTLLFAREERYRGAGLEGAVKEAAGFSIKLDEDNYPEQTARGLTWAPFVYRDGAWQGYSTGEYYPVLADQLRVRFWAENPEATADEIEGRVAVARGYYMGLVTGVVQTLDPTQQHHEGASDTELATAGSVPAAANIASISSWLSEVTDSMYRQIINAIMVSRAGGLPSGAGMIVDEFGNIYLQPSKGYSLIGKALDKGYSMSKGAWKTMLAAPRPYKAAGLALVAVALVTMAVCMIVGLSTDKDTIELVMSAANLLVYTQFMVIGVADLTKAVKALGGLGKLVKDGLLSAGLKQLISTIKNNAFGVLGAVASGLMAWASFGLAWWRGGLSAGSMAWDDALATAIATTIATILLFLVYFLLGPLGMIIKSLIGLIDGLVGMICSTFLSEEQQASQAGQWLCGGITGAVRKLVKWLIYSGEIIVDMNPDQEKGPPWYPRLTFGTLDIDLERPDDGIVAGNKIGFTISLTNALNLAEVPISPWAQLWSAQWSTKNLKKSNFQYKWQSEEIDFHEGLKLGMISPAWDTSKGLPYRYKVPIATGTVIPLSTAGINQSLSPLYVSEAYAVPEQECWGLFPYGGCGISTVRGTYHYDFGASLVFDVLPNNLTDFYHLGEANYPKWRQDWGQAESDESADLLFPALYDADGDSLPADTDPNDSLWDADFDGLGDEFERETGSDPSRQDTDGDGLTDAEEARAKTNPRLKDTDGDGLADGDEVHHQDVLDADGDGDRTEWLGGWEFVYGRDDEGNPLITRVYSDPTTVDADGDNLSDKQEYIFGFNPTIPSDLNVLTLESQVSENEGGAPAPTDGFVKPGDTLYYTATVKNELDLRQAQGLLGTRATLLLDAAKIPNAKPFILDALEEETQTGALGVSSTAASGAYSLTQVAGALITNWRTGSGGASLWLRFDEAAGAYRDTSGSQPAHDGSCVGGGCSIVANGRYGSAIHLDGNGYVHSDAPVSASGYAVSFWFNADSSGGALGRTLFTDQDPITGRKRVEILYAETYVRASVTGCNANGCGQENLFSGQDLLPQGWHHIVHTYGGQAGKQKLYVDGRLLQTGTFQEADASVLSSNANIGGSPASGLGFVGTIDDVRLYDRGLTAEEVSELFDQPVFHMDFEKQDGWEDTSVFDAPVTCAPSIYCPAHDKAGIQANAVRLNGTSFLSVAGSTQLDLSAGKYSISAWIYPEKGCGFDAQRNAVQMIVGSDADPKLQFPTLRITTDPYQSLASVGTGFGTGITYESANAPWSVPFGQWTHLVMTFDTDEVGDDGKQGKWRLYTNGTEAWHASVTTSGARPYRTLQFQIGAGTQAQARGDHSFCGKIDELYVYNRVLGAETVAALMRDGASALHLPFDDAPGESAFHDTSVAARQIPCGVLGCPVSGMRGRLNQAASFDGAAGQTLALGNGPINQMTSGFSVAAWIKPAATVGTQRIISTGRPGISKSDDGWGFGLYGSDLNLSFYGFDRSNYILGNFVPGGANLQAGRWVHVAAVMDYAGAVTFYVDGVPKGTTPRGSGGIADTDNELLIAASGGSTAPIEKFSGLIDDLWVYGTALTAEQVAALYGSAPVLHLPFDEAYGSDSFQDSAAYGRSGGCDGDACPLAGEGVRGQVGLAAQFDGVDDKVTVPLAGTLPTPEFTIGAWIWPSSLTPEYLQSHEVVSKWSDSEHTRIELSVWSDMTAQLYAICGVSAGTAKTTVPLIADHWNHVMATSDGHTFRVYLNGYESATGSAPEGTCTYDYELRVGGDGSNRFTGRVDEVTVYDHLLQPSEVLDLYNYQAGWVEDRQSQTLVVDNEPPTASVVIADGVHLANWPVVVSLDAQDASSGIRSVDLEDSKGGRTPAVLCADPSQGPAWCATFTPSGEGVYTLKAKATDLVGRTAESAGKTVYVDATPPTLTLNQADGQLLGVTHSSTEANVWLIHVSGTVSDKPAVAGTASGIPADGVRVTLRDAEGEALGEVGQLASILGEAWSIDYRVGDARPDGCYTVHVEAIDNIVASIPNLPADQVAQHMTAASIGVVIDSAAPQVVLDQAAIAGRMLGGSVKNLGGGTTERPVPVQVVMATSAGAEKTRVKLACQHGNAGSWYTVFDMAPGQLSPEAGSTWAGKLHKGSNCVVELTTSAASGGVAGTIKVCGEELDVNPDWTGDFSPSLSIPFVVQSDNCFARGCSTDQRVAGAQKVEVAFTSVLRGSPWLNETPLPDEIIHLPLDDSLNADGSLPVRDVSGVAASSTYTGTTAPIPGQAGHLGSAFLFDGVDDAVYSYYVAGYDVTDHLSISGWIKPTGAPYGTGDFIARKNRYLLSRTGDGTIRWAFGNIDGYHWHYTPYKAPLNEWTHVMVVYDNGTVVTYANGAPVDTYSGSVSGSVSSNSWLEVGGYSTYGSFAGLIDDVRVINRSLDADEVKALYTGSDPLLVLPFEDPLLADGDTVVDASSWGQNGILHSGDAQNKSVPGQVGNYALALDGMDDYVDAGDRIDLTSSSLSAAFWAKRAETGRWDIALGLGPAGSFTRFHMGFTNTNLFRCAFYGAGSYVDTDAYTEPGWHHWACTYDATTNTMIIYRDGTLVKQGNTTADFSGSGHLYIGAAAPNEYPFKGLLDELRIYGRALSSNEIADLYNAGWHAATPASSGAGVESTSWTLTVPTGALGLEGTYRLDMRGTDADGHSQAVSERDQLWQGEIDNLGPRVTLCKALVSDTTYRYVAVARDYNLDEKTFSSPCPITSRVNYESPWLLSTIPAGSTKLYQVRADCPVSTTPTEQATACDSAGNCTSAGLTTGGACDSILAGAASQHWSSASQEGDLAILPVITEEGGPPAIAFASKVLTGTHFAGGTVVIAGYVTGLRHVIGVQVTVDGVTGVATLSDPQSTPPYTVTWSYPWLPPAGTSLDGTTVQASATVTALATAGGGQHAPAHAMDDQAYRVFLPLVSTTYRPEVSYSVDETLTVDVVAPGEVALALTANGAPVEPGEVLRWAEPELRLAWETSSDGSGVAGYIARWTTNSALTRTVAIRVHGAAGPFEDRYQAGEAQQVGVELLIRDAYGNQRAQSFGPFLVDGPLTPDWVQLPANGETAADRAWMESGCTLAGTDGRAAKVSAASGRPEQHGYASWDQRGLRLTWTGADWGGNGDLFIYFDSGPGGAGEAFSPYPVPEKASKILLPPGMAANRLIWVQDAEKASLLKWEGSAWVVLSALSRDQYRFDPAALDGRTDLYLPFDMLGISAGDGLGVVAFATEEPDPAQGLQIWATLPKTNPANSAWANVRAPIGKALGEKGINIPLLHFWRSASMGDGICPNQRTEQQRTDIQLVASVASVPAGATAAGLEGPLFWAESPARLLAAAAAGEDNNSSTATAGDAAASSLVFDLLNPAHLPLADGQGIDYSVRVANTGSRTLVGAWLALEGYGSLRLLEESVDLGDIPAGEERTATFHGVADLSRSATGLAVALAQIYATGYGPEGSGLDWLVAVHRVDRGAPEKLGVDLWTTWVGPYTNEVSGHAFDESGVTEITLELTGPEGQMATVTCPLRTREAGRWSCQWDAETANGGVLPPDGTEITVRVKATDRHGQVSPWSQPHAVRFDAQPPTVTVPSDLKSVQRGRLRLSGTTADAAGLAELTICLDGRCGTGNLWRGIGIGGAGAPARWSFIPAIGASDFMTHTVSVQAADPLGNRTLEPDAFQIVVDNVAPHVTATQAATQMDLGSAATVLTGTATDGGPSLQTWVRVQKPDGDLVLRDVLEAGDNWSFDLSGERPGRYLLSVETRDFVGNRTTVGPYAVDVTCTDAALATMLTVERIGTGSTYSVTAVISNTGPAELPPGVPVTLYAGETPLGAAQLLPALAAGQASRVSAQWTRPGSGAFEFSAVVDESQSAVLCATPPMGKAWVGRDVDLRIRKMVQPAVAVPGDVITYTLVYSNVGADLATGVVISDPLPAEILAPAYQPTGAVITPVVGSGNYAWQVADLAGGLGGQIVISGTIDPAVTPPITITNAVTITALQEISPADNVASVKLPVVREIAKPPRVWLPWVARE